MNKLCCIFAAGEYYGNETLPEEPFFSVAADGGYIAAEKMGVKPDVLIGDFDSLETEPACKEIIRLKPEKDDTDTLSAVKLALARGCDSFYFYGCTGGRTAHTLSNLQTLSYLAKQGCRGRIIGNGEVFTCLNNGSIRFSEKSKGYLSVFSLSDESRGVCESGLEYTLDDYTMTNSFPIGTSNAFIGEEAVVSVRDGTLLLVYTDCAEERTAEE